MGVTDRITAAWGALTTRNAVIPPWPAGQDNFWPYANLSQGYGFPLGLSQTIRGKAEEVDGSFEGLANVYKTNGIVYACMLARSQLFSEARFQFQQLRKGEPGDLFANPSLDILEHPWPNGVTGDLLRRALQDHDLAGNAFFTRRGGALRRMRPDWVTIVLGSPNDPQVQAGDIDAEVLGYIYHPGGRYSGRDPEALLRREVCHFMAEPDPLASFRGMSWLIPVMREIAADMQLTSHKTLYLENGATPNMVVSLDKDAKASESPAAFAEWIALFKKTNPTGGWDKFKTMYLSGGTTMEVVGGNLGSEGVDFKQVQGAGETRIAAAAGVPPIVVGLSEGLQAATYSNYGQARRRFADNTMRPLWRNFSGSMEVLVPPPGGSRLWYDDRHIQALAEDRKDLAEIQQLESQQIRTLTDAGYTPESVIEAVVNDDFSRLVHTGLFSVQLQPPMPDGPPKPEPAPLVPIAAASNVEALVASSEARMYRAIDAISRETPPPQVYVYTPEQVVNLTLPEAPAPNVVVNAPQVTVEPPQVNIEQAQIFVEAPNVTVEPPEVTVNVPEQRTVTKTVVRNDKNEIVAFVETPDGD